jgi:hypothetical protein
MNAGSKANTAGTITETDCEEFESLEALKQECEARGIDYEFDAYEELLPKSEKIK